MNTRNNILGVVFACLVVLGCGDDSGSGGEEEEGNVTPQILNPGGGGGAPVGGTPAIPVVDAGSPSDAVATDGVTGTDDGIVSDSAVGDGVVAEDTTDVDDGPQLTPCDDKVPCTIETYLSDDGKCEGGKFICGDCAGSGCNFDSDCTPFNDQNPCNGVLKCASGHCVVDEESKIACSGEESDDPNERIRCNPSNGLCEPEPLPDGAACDDGNPCTLYDVMFGGQCGGTDVCAPCDALADGTVCDDGNPCTDQTLCNGGRCVGANVCECLYSKDCVELDDENACNGRMTCIAGACQVNPDTVVHCQRACPDDTCYQGDCIEEKGICVGKSIPDCQAP